ncbi:MAG: 5'-methylthioadenosine/adenosylhomocysteine nucleosidase [Phycisphaerae bacterium]|nr:5'-methylthioadenosine/adenosylhomocysteine nucleosidase [Phycisphaerae bacterium]
MKIGIMGAMHEEIALFRDSMVDVSTQIRGMREYTSGKLAGCDVVVVFSRWGKVAASATATTLIERFDVDMLIFTGVAGAMAAELEVGDIVIADSLIQHDMDVSFLPNTKKFEIPLLGVSNFTVDDIYVQLAQSAAQSYLTNDLRTNVPENTLVSFNVTEPKVVVGLIASGDQFIADPAIADKLCSQLPGLQCVEMEGAAVAQVAYEHSIPCIVMRTISDKADHSAAVDFQQFTIDVASHFTCGSVMRLLESL